MKPSRSLAPFLATLCLVGCPTKTPAAAPADAPIGAGSAQAAVDAAVQKWRTGAAWSGRYRSVQDPIAARSARKPNPEKGTMLQIHEGRFAQQGRRFRTTGTQRIEYTAKGEKKPEGGSAELDLLFDDQTLTMASKSSMRIPSTYQVVRIGPALFDKDKPFTVMTPLRGAPFGAGDVATTLEKLGGYVRFDGQERVIENGVQMTKYKGATDAERAIDMLIAERSPALGVLIEAGKRGPDDTMADMQADTTVRALGAQRVVHIYIDDDGHVRGWDVGPEAGRWALTMRLTEIEPKVKADAFAFPPELTAQAVDQTPAIKAQTDALRKAFDDADDVAKVRKLLIEKFKTANATPPTP